jgi:ABC-2 type transport system permease protein
MMRALLAQTRVEARLALRRGENVLVMLLIPATVLLTFGSIEKSPAGYVHTVDFLLPGVLALAVMSAAMVTLGIATAYERYYRVLKRLGATPLSRLELMAAKVGAIVLIEGLQVVVLVALGAVLLGWRPEETGWEALPLLGLGTVCFAALGLLMAGTLRAEATLGLANALYLGFLALGGIVAPLDRLPGWLVDAVRFLPATALARVLRATLAQGSPPGVLDVCVLLVWAGCATLLTLRLFSWE